MPRIQCNCAKILIIDDNEFNLYSLKLLLESLDQKCDTENNGKDAVDAVLKKENENDCDCSYQLIIMDCMMHVMDGWTACNILRVKEKEIFRQHIFALSADTTSSNK